MTRWIIAGLAVGWAVVWVMGYAVIWLPDGAARDNWKETVGLSVVGLIFLTTIGLGVLAIGEAQDE